MSTQTTASEAVSAEATEETVKPLVPGENLLGAPSAGSCCGGSACGV